MPDNLFIEHTVESAPAGAGPVIQATINRLGYLPVAVARMASAPQLLEGFLKASALFEASSLDPVAREVLILTIATRNGCHVCVAMHTARLVALGAAADLIAELREQRPLSDDRLDAIRIFTLQVLASTGAVDEAPMRAFLAHGYTPRHALEVVLGIGAYTMSTLANRMTGAALDEQLAPFAWAEVAA
jgi:AhpD family alkylhydroperoxidase